jgi:hypothetical protein
MRKFLVVIALTAAAAVAATAQDPEPRALVEKAVKAANLPDTAKLSATTWKDKGRLTAGGMTIEYTADWWLQLPDRYRFVLAAEIMGQKIDLVVVAAGGKAWESARGMTREVTGEKLEYVSGEVYQMWVQSLTPLLADADFKLRPALTKDVDGRRGLGVKVERSSRPTVTLYFDDTTGLLIKSEVRVKDEFQNWKEVLDEVYYGGYQERDGRKTFTKLRVVRDGKPLIESTLSDVRWYERLDPKLFEPPGKN